jgi:hypothetical protein
MVMSYYLDEDCVDIADQTTSSRAKAAKNLICPNLVGSSRYRKFESFRQLLIFYPFMRKLMKDKQFSSVRSNRQKLS